MAAPRRIQRLEKLIKVKIASTLQRDAKDPRLGLITITRVELDRELVRCKVYWSVLGDEKARRLNEAGLQHARRFIQHEVAEVLETRTVPQLEFVFDESIEGADRVARLLEELERERRQDGGGTGEDRDPEGPDPGFTPDRE
ncbi:MAG: 30S ribosome-binding factor RbfA [Planctomycetota bacterium]